VLCAPCLYTRSHTVCRALNLSLIFTQLVWFVGFPASMGVIVVYVFNEEYKLIRKEKRNGMVSAGSYLLARTLLEAPMIVLLSICAVSVSGYGVMRFHASNFHLLVAIHALMLWAFESMALLFSVLFDNPLLGMLMYMNFWFAAFLFSGLMVRESSVVWPLRAFCYVLPLKFSVQGMAIIEFDGPDFAGAQTAPCPASLASTPPVGCTYNLVGEDGFTCPDMLSQQGCYGATGKQVLESIGQQFKLITSDPDTLSRDFAYILGIGAFFKFSYILVFMLKTMKSSKITERPGAGHGDAGAITRGTRAAAAV